MEKQYRTTKSGASLLYPFILSSIGPIVWFIIAMSMIPNRPTAFKFCMVSALLAGATKLFLTIQEMANQPPNEVLSVMKVICGFVIPIILVLGGMAYTAIENLPPPKPKEKQEKQQKEKVLAWRKEYSAYIYREFNKNNKDLLFNDLDMSITVTFNSTERENMIVPFFLGSMEEGGFTTRLNKDAYNQLSLKDSPDSCCVMLLKNTWRIEQSATLPILRWRGRKIDKDYKITLSYKEGCKFPYAIRGVIKDCPAKKPIVFVVPTKVTGRRINTRILIVACSKDGSELSSHDGVMSIAIDKKKPLIIKDSKWSIAIREYDKPVTLVLGHNYKKPVDIFIAFRPL